MDKPWKQEERAVARLLHGTRYKANTGGRVDVEGPEFIAQVKHVKRMSLAQIEALALEMCDLGIQRRKEGVLVVKRRSGRGIITPRLVIMTESVFERLMEKKGIFEGIQDEVTYEAA